MALFDELKRLTRPFDDEDDDFYEEADESFIPSKPRPAEREGISSEQARFEDAFADDYRDSPEPARQPRRPSSSGRAQSKTQGAGGSIFGNLGEREQKRPQAQVQPPPYQEQAPRSPRQNRKQRSPGVDQQVVLFNPKNFDDAGDLVNYVSQGRSLVMALEGIPTETARRLLDFISGICFAMNAKITPVSAKTYFITPENVDLLDAQSLQSESAEQEDF